MVKMTLSVEVKEEPGRSTSASPANCELIIKGKGTMEECKAMVRRLFREDEK